MPLSPCLHRRSVILGAGALAALSARTAGAAPLSDAVELSSLDKDVACALSVELTAIRHEMDVEGRVPKAAYNAAVARSEAASKVVSVLTAELLRRPIRSLGDCVTYARLIEAHEDLPAFDQIDGLGLSNGIGDVRMQALAGLVLGLLKLADAPRRRHIFRPMWEPEPADDNSADFNAQEDNDDA